jgi:hypothetical protein
MNKYWIKGGVGLLLLALTLFSQQAWAATYAGNIFITSGALAGSSIIGVFGSKPNQTATTGDIANTVTDNQVYASVTYAKKIAIEGSADNSVYVLFKNGTSTYATLSVTLQSTYVPNITVDTLTFYNQGSPPEPTIGTITAKYESAMVNSISYASGYEYTGAKIEVAGTGSGIKTIAPKPTTFSMGELVNSITLESGATYTFKVCSTVDGVADSPWAEKPFTMLSGGGPLSAVVTLKAGMNFFSLGIPPASGNKWYAGTSELLTIGDLIAKIGNDRVSTFGYVDLAGNVVGVKKVGTAFEPTAALTLPLSQTQGYQVYITPGADIMLTLSNTL